MSLVYVQHRSIVVRDEHEAVQYGSWSRQTNFTVEGVTLDTTKRWGYDAIQIAPAVVVGDEVWVLWVTYYSGDSFGSDSGQGEIIWVFTEENVANKALGRLEQAGTKINSFSFVDEDDEDIRLCNPAGDYFSGVECFHLQKFIVGDCPEPRY